MSIKGKAKEIATVVFPGLPYTIAAPTGEIESQRKQQRKPTYRFSGADKTRKKRTKQSIAG